MLVYLHECSRVSMTSDRGEVSPGAEAIFTLQSLAWRRGVRG
jgi:hypothetical protein